MLSILEEIRKIAPIRPAEPSSAMVAESTTSTDDGQWSLIHDAITRLGKQQMRANQSSDHVLEQFTAAVEEARGARGSMVEMIDEQRREILRMREDAREARLAALGILDSLDDLAVLARQREDPHWISRVERLTARTLEGLSLMGVSEIPGEGAEFDESFHDVMERVDRGELEPYKVVEVIRRGFRYDGTVLRRSQTIITH